MGDVVGFGMITSSVTKKSFGMGDVADFGRITGVILSGVSLQRNPSASSIQRIFCTIKNLGASSDFLLYKKSPLLCKEDCFVGVAGFEPATSWSQTRRDDRATLHPENVSANIALNLISATEALKMK